MTDKTKALLPVTPDIVAAAKIIDPDAWHQTLPTDGCGVYWMSRRSKARSQAEEVLALYKADNKAGGLWYRRWHEAQTRVNELERSQSHSLPGDVGMREALERTLSDPQRLLWRDDVEGICPTPGVCWEYGDTARCGPCAIKQAEARGVVSDMSVPNLPEVYRLRRELASRALTDGEALANELDAFVLIRTNDPALAIEVGNRVRAALTPSALSEANQTLDLEGLGDALAALSAKLLASGFLNDDANHAAYEKVVAAFQALPSALSGDAGEGE